MCKVKHGFCYACSLKLCIYSDCPHTCDMARDSFFLAYWVQCSPVLLYATRHSLRLHKGNGGACPLLIVIMSQATSCSICSLIGHTWRTQACPCVIKQTTWYPCFAISSCILLCLMASRAGSSPCMHGPYYKVSYSEMSLVQGLLPKGIYPLVQCFAELEHEQGARATP